MDGWNTTFLLGRPIFRGYVSFREGSNPFNKAGYFLGGVAWGGYPLNSHDMLNLENIAFGSLTNL